MKSIEEILAIHIDTNVLCDVTDKDQFGNVTVYPTSGNIVSFVMNPLYLSEGWK